MDAQTTPTPTPQILREEVIVTANRTETKLSDTPASVVTIGRTEITTSAAPTLDDVLRQTAGFSIFRRSSSRNANPTTQGVSLRGVGASGASRSIVMFDGVPLGDPFGGWVQWNRVPPIGVETVEVVRGGASSLYGSAGLSGAINILPRQTGKDFIGSADVFGGMQKTISGSAFAGMHFGPWAADAVIASFQTRGYRPVDPDVRGTVDGFAGARSSVFSGRFMRQFGETGSLFFRPSYFGEVRTNGTALQTNRTHIRQLVFGGERLYQSPRSVRISLRAYGGTQVFDQIFTAINAARTTESLTRAQRVPAQNMGLSAQASGVLGDHALLGGVDLRNVRGASDEIGFSQNRATALIAAGGRESVVGVFFQDFVRIGERIVVTGGLRLDRWKNYKGSSIVRPLAPNSAVTTMFDDRREDALSPRVSILGKLSDEISIYASAGRSFRSPTLNELYRAFRVGNVMTLANENLRAERSTNIETGASYTTSRFSVRGSGFWTRVDEAVANVTLLIAPDVITRQRQNAASTTSSGADVDGEVRFRSLSLSGGYLFTDSRVSLFPSNAQIIGLRIPQVPRHQFTGQARHLVKRWTVALQARGAGSQFDDDLNVFRLGRYFQADVFVSRDLKENLKVYFAVENVFSSRYSIGRTPIRTVSAPANFRMGIRWY
ncbi:MAG: TonB-dependent receptor [Pyrinomonadaceae bacterium]